MMIYNFYMAKKYFLSLILTVLCFYIKAQDFDLYSVKNQVSIVCNSKDSTLDAVVANLLAKDIEAVCGYKPPIYKHLKQAKGNVILLGQVKNAQAKAFRNYYPQEIENQFEIFAIKRLKNPTSKIKDALIITGSDARGLAYGVFHISEKIGIHPWYYWADVTPQKKKQLSVSIKDTISKTPSVKYRGIFLNDEDWGLRPWAAQNIDKNLKNIGPNSYAKIFELLLRLKANTIWPAMHPGTKAFFSIPENLKIAKQYEIIIGSSHAEPMLRNNVDEWDKNAMGAFNYVDNSFNINDYWQKRIKETTSINAIYSLGIRGVHDSGMEGIKNNKEAIKVLGDVFTAQRNMLKNTLKKDIKAIPQALTLYKEVLDIYDEGLPVPDDVNLVWPDDNYGYIRRLGNPDENKRKGGAGVYYHVSYWGRPHDYLWLCTTPPALIHQEMLKAYRNEAKSIWILNVGDIKPAEYQTQLFLDMAYDITPFHQQVYVQNHLKQWYQQIFNANVALKLNPILQKYYQLAFERKPEYMGWSQTEPTTPTQLTAYNHFAYGDEGQKRIKQYQQLVHDVLQLKKNIPAHLQDAYFQLISYPVLAASEMNKKFLYHDKAVLYQQQGRLSAISYQDSVAKAFNNIHQLTKFYNDSLSAGKWKGMMHAQPRGLPVFDLPKSKTTLNTTSSEAWGLHVEGTAPTHQADTISFPILYSKASDSTFLDIFLKQAVTLSWQFLEIPKWLKVSQATGNLSSSTKEIRIWFKPDVAQLKQERQVAYLKLQTNLGVKTLQLVCHPQPKVKDTFTEQNGFISIYAVNYTSKRETNSFKWEKIDGLGYAGSVIKSNFYHHLVTAQDSMILSYNFMNTTSAKAKVDVFTIPTHPLNNLFSLKYAVRIDGGAWQIKNFEVQGRSTEWKENVLRNNAVKTFVFDDLKPGKHRLEIMALDPEIMFDRVLISLKEHPKAYGLMPETN
ncbi:hypothetical protein GJJ64_06325 [Pedobacter sp. HX-22-1]|uniref:Gylcosyl hydrolase 115 C-terminal domain-containing protein n=2 Tax=Pedobacter puniceum TaxID=2666136 RepID=A0A7K0FMY8_9SPHI|nr:hypothetical protein [Pedobacter puniceum]